MRCSAIDPKVTITTLKVEKRIKILWCTFNQWHNLWEPWHMNICRWLVHGSKTQVECIVYRTVWFMVVSCIGASSSHPSCVLHTCTFFLSGSILYWCKCAGYWCMFFPWMYSVLVSICSILVYVVPLGVFCTGVNVPGIGECSSPECILYWCKCAGYWCMFFPLNVFCTGVNLFYISVCSSPGCILYLCKFVMYWCMFFPWMYSLLVSICSILVYVLPLYLFCTFVNVPGIDVCSSPGSILY